MHLEFCYCHYCRSKYGYQEDGRGMMEHRGNIWSMVHIQWIEIMEIYETRKISIGCLVKAINDWLISPRNT